MSIIGVHKDGFSQSFFHCLFHVTSSYKFSLELILGLQIAHILEDGPIYVCLSNMEVVHEELESGAGEKTVYHWFGLLWDKCKEIRIG